MCEVLSIDFGSPISISIIIYRKSSLSIWKFYPNSDTNNTNREFSLLRIYV